MKDPTIFFYVRISKRMDPMHNKLDVHNIFLMFINTLVSNIFIFSATVDTHTSFK